MGRSILARVGMGLAALTVVAVSGGFTWAVADDYTVRDVVPEGVSVAGVDVGGMARSEARERIENDVASPLLQPVTASFGSRAYEFDPRRSLTVDVDGMLAEAIATRRDRSLIDRVSIRLTGRPTAHDVPVKLAVDRASMDTWLDETAEAVNRPAIDAKMQVDGTTLSIQRERIGFELKREAATDALVSALEKGDKRLNLPVKSLPPKVKASSFGTTIVVSISQRRLYLYKGATLEKKYGVAVGTPGHPTPRGEFKIVHKRYLPTWVNPGSDWAKSMPKTIPPGPSNPLGTRALNLDAPGIRIHGTTNDASIGSAASHGCMRMHRWDIEDLYPRVPVGTKVFIVG